jgi:heme exporter protein CcmD
MNPWNYIIACYAVFAVFLVLDALLPWLRQRRLMRTLAERGRRQRNRSTQS